MTSVNAPRAVKEKPLAYERFIGLETMRDSTNQDTGTKQPLLRLSGGYIDGLGQIVKDPGADRIHSATNVVETQHYDLFDLTWIEKTAGGYVVKSSSGRNADLGWSPNALPTTAHFNSRLLYLAQGQVPWIYNGAMFVPVDPSKPLANRLRPSFGCTVQSRFVVAGMPQFPGVVEVSRVNDLDYFSEEEKDDEESVNRGGKIDIWSVIGKRETLTGLCSFETNKLVVFTASRGLIYRLTTDIDGWAIEDRTSITTGCISHRTVVEAGQDVLYCSRTGVYTVARSRDNGTMVTSASLSDNIALLYRSLVRSVPDPRLISAVWDSDESQYHIFFPQTLDRSFRLTMTVDPTNPLATARWSLAEEFIRPLCGDFFEGSLVYGSADGLYQIGKIEEDYREANPDLLIETPTLYLGSFTDQKQISSLILSASGKSILQIEMVDAKTGKVLWDKRVEAEEAARPELFHNVPLSEHRRIPVNVRTTSCRLRITAKGAGIFRLAGFAFVVGS